MLKKIIRTVAVLFLAATLSQTVFSSEGVLALKCEDNGAPELSADPGSNLRWTNVNQTTSSLTFESGKANIDFRIFGKTGTTYTNGTAKLVKIVGGNETPVATWSGLSGTSKTYVFSSNSVSVTSGTYKATLVIYAARYGLYEKIELEVTATY